MNNESMFRILFIQQNTEDKNLDNAAVLPPLSFPGMRDRGERNIATGFLGKFYSSCMKNIKIFPIF